MKLLKTIRADSSDTFVFEKAAAPGEWAVSGAFAFARLDPTALVGKARAAFRGGFLGVDSLGWSTLVQIVTATEQDRRVAIEMLARRLVEHFGAPDLAVAVQAAEEEIEFAASLADQPEGLFIAVTRRYEEGAIRESFRALSPRASSGPINIAALSREGSGA